MSVCCDATGYLFPDGPLLIFTSNPFGSKVMDEVLRNRARHADTFYFIQENVAFPLHDLAAGGFLTLLASDSACRVYGRR